MNYWCDSLVVVVEVVRAEADPGVPVEIDAGVPPVAELVGVEGEGERSRGWWGGLVPAVAKGMHAGARVECDLGQAGILESLRGEWIDGIVGEMQVRALDAAARPVHHGAVVQIAKVVDDAARAGHRDVQLLDLGFRQQRLHA